MASFVVGKLRFGSCGVQPIIVMSSTTPKNAFFIRDVSLFHLYMLLCSSVSDSTVSVIRAAAASVGYGPFKRCCIRFYRSVIWSLMDTLGSSSLFGVCVVSIQKIFIVVCVKLG